MKRTPLARKSSLKRGGRVKPINAKRRTSEFARAYHSKASVRHVKAMPCYACGQAGETDAAHGETGGMGYKAGWETLLPLCRRCHTKQHQSGWLAIGMTEESRQRAARLTQDTFEERYAEGD